LNYTTLIVLGLGVELVLIAHDDRIVRGQDRQMPGERVRSDWQVLVAAGADDERRRGGQREAGAPGRSPESARHHGTRRETPAPSSVRARSSVSGAPLNHHCWTTPRTPIMR